MHDSRAVANRFLALAQGEGRSLTPMQVLKLVYIAHGWDLGLYGAPLIRDRVEAWQYGPVIPSLYNAMKDYRGSTVTSPLSADQGDPALTRREKALISDVFQKYGSRSGLSLSRLTHAAGTPWAQTYRPGVFSIEIPRDLIQDHYELLARASSGAGREIHS